MSSWQGLTETTSKFASATVSAFSASPTALAACMSCAGGVVGGMAATVANAQSLGNAMSSTARTV